MSESTKIAWCDSTFNPWIGCTKVGPGCDNCYAAEQDSRKRWDGGKTHWGAGVPRYRTSAANWAQPLRWNAKQQDLRRQGDAPPWRVFCASLADVFDNEVPEEWRTDLWFLIRATPHLQWLLVTKRVGNAIGMVPMAWLGANGLPPNVRILITVCNQEEADRDIPKLLALPCKNGISYEPALGPINWIGDSYGPNWLEGWAVESEWDRGEQVPVQVQTRALEWVIVGGESGSKARPFDVGWARSTIEQCKAVGVPVFYKQGGASNACAHDRAGAHFECLPADLQIRQFPDA